MNKHTNEEVEECNFREGRYCTHDKTNGRKVICGMDYLSQCNWLE